MAVLYSVWILVLLQRYSVNSTINTAYREEVETIENIVPLAGDTTLGQAMGSKAHSCWYLSTILQ